VSCARRPSVHVVTTGDELVAPGQPRVGEGVWNSNAISIPAQARRAGAHVELLERVADAHEPTVAAVRDGLAADVLVLCGGVSVGPHDHVKAAFAELGVVERFWGVALRPGHPTWFGTYDGDRHRTLVFGLPGNPVSAMVTFQLFVTPALRALQGGDPSPTTTTAILDEDVDKRPGRMDALRCRAELRDDGWHVQTTGPQGSHVLSSMVGADALAMLPEDSAGERAGARVVVELIG
jgi:molybdopterin molybdotransferase